MSPTTKHLRALLLGAVTIAGLGVITLAPRPAVAQADLGSVSGTVTDASGAVIARASVTVTNTETGAVRTSVTNSIGGYSISQLNPGTYSVSITAAGFASANQDVSVTVGSQNTFSAKLAVAGGKTEVTVSADNFAGVQLEKPEVSAVIETDQILSLPTLDRNPYSLVAFSGNLSSDPTAASRGVGFNISGSRSSSVDILLDGAENTDLYAVGIGQTVPLDATSEIRIVTSNSGAEYGRGAGAVNVSTKSGTNGLHGSVYEYNRISTLASDGYNNNYIHAVDPSVAAKPRYVHNQFGYSVGGPVKKDKLFFFSSTEWTRIRSAQNIIAVVPTPDLIAMSDASTTQAFFSQFGKLQFPINGAKFTGASPAVQANFATDISDLSARFPNIGTTELFGESIYQAAADSGGGTPVNQWISFNRGDVTFTKTTSMFVRYIQESAIFPAGSNNSSPYEGYNTGTSQINHNLAVSISKAFTPTLASATKLLGSRLNNSQPLGTQPVSPTLYINPGNPVTLGGGYINLPGYLATSPGNALPFGGPQNFIEAGEDLAWTKGKHQFTFGGAFLFIKDNRTFGAYEEAIDGLVTSGTEGALENLVNGGFDYLNVAIDPKGTYPCSKNAAGHYPTDRSGCSFPFPATSPNFSRSNRYQDGNAYATDSYKVTPNLTLNLGLRWEIYGPQHSQEAAYDANFFPDYTQTNVFDQFRNGQVLTRVNAPGGKLWNLNKKQFGPRVGFAYDPFGNGKTSIRGGYGITYERNFNNVTFNVIQNPPNYAVIALQTGVDFDGTIPISTNNFSSFGTGTGTHYLPNVTLRAVDPRIKPAYANNWSLSVEHQMQGTTASISYVGTRGIHNYSIANYNRAGNGSVYEGDARAANRSNYQYGSINWRGADGDSYYNGATAELRSANLHNTGLTVRADYTWSRSIDNTSSTFSDSGNVAGGGLILGYTDPYNKALDRGPSDFDQAQRFTSAIVWDVPFAKQTTGATKLIADNWTLSTTFSAATGTPYTEFDTGWVSGLNSSVYPRANFVNKPSRTKTRGMNDISSTYGPNTYSYLSLPPYVDANGNFLASNYNEQVNPIVNGSEFPICSSLHAGGCRWGAGMDGRNSFRGPGSWNENLGIIKDFKVHDRYDLQLKGEFINVFNHANTDLNLGGANDVASYTDVFAYKSGNRNTELSIHVAF